MGTFIDLTGQRFGLLTVVGRAGSSKHWQALWHCECDCGGKAVVQTQNLKKGVTKSCGCLQRERTKAASTTHGGTHERLHGVWTAMKSRCNNPNNKRYKYYGLRGIKVCEEWSKSYAAFRDWALRTGYDPEAPRGACTIDRIDVDGDYCPENCRWVDNDTQAKNKRKGEQ